MPLVPRRSATLLLIAGLAAGGCAAGQLLRYSVRPNPPAFEGGEAVAAAGLSHPVDVRRTPDGVWHLSATAETDAMHVLGYLQARDRMFQLDLFRHIAQGRLAELVGNVELAGRTALDMDRMNRFLGFRQQAEELWANTVPAERAAIEAFAAGVRHWQATGRRSLEHRLLGIGEDAIEPWDKLDSLTVYAMIMHGLSNNANREWRRLLLACDAGLDGMERVWPTMIDPHQRALPAADLRPVTYPVPPSVVPAVAEALPGLCRGGQDSARNRRTGGAESQSRSAGAVSAPRFVRQAAVPLDLLGRGWPASNNWVVAGAHTASGAPVLANDPHLPLLSPPLLWGYEIELPGSRYAGFTLVGLHRLVFGHNGHVAWGQTTNHLDSQDLYLLQPTDGDGRAADPATATHYRWESVELDFAVHTERFGVKGGNAVTQSVRFTRHGPVLNDLEPVLVEHGAPLVALRTTGVGRGFDLNGARRMATATSVAEFAAAIDWIDGDCSNWVIADRAGAIAYRSPCVLPVREGWTGTFPVAGWLGRYLWQEPVPKAELPRSTDPERGWLATANSRIVPVDRFPTAYNGDPSPTNRLDRIRALLFERAVTGGPLTVTASAGIQLDQQLSHWPRLRTALAPAVCGNGEGRAAVPVPAATVVAARRALCAWNGSAAAGSTAMTVFVHMTHAALDLALADEVGGGAGGELWHTVQDVLQFEANVQRLWSEPATAPVWDDVRTEAVEDRTAILAAAFAAGVAEAHRRYGADVDAWAWGTVRPFVLRHMFAGNDGILGRVLNHAPLPGGGHVTTPYKLHYPRADRADMNPIVGPVIRFNVDMVDPWAATYSLAGGQSGWPLSPHYGDLLADWHAGRGRPLTPPPGPEDVRVRFVPASSPTP